MIKKTIHYCWFGGNELPELAKKCINSWKENLPEYEIMRWDESNFDINSNQYVREAYECKKYAFVSDYVRLYALYNHGGIYMDTDVEVLQKLDKFLNHDAFSGFETYKHIPTGIMASIKGHKGIGELLDYYTDRSFIKEDGSYDMTTNVQIITNYYLERGLKQNNKLQTVDDFTFYPKIVFCPFKLDINNENKNEIYTIHHFAGSWLTEEEKNRRNSIIYKLKCKFILNIRTILIKILGKRNFEKMRGRE